MNCDRAFELLTDPLESGRPEMAQHLAVCPRCRQMQETLSPALSWLTSEAEREPGWLHGSGSSGPLLTREAVQVAAELARTLPAVRRDHLGSLRKTLGIALVAAAGMLLGAIAVEQRRAQPVASHTALASLDPAAITVCLWTRPDASQGLPTTSARSVVDSCMACHVP